MKENWRKLTNDSRILDIVKNCHLELSKIPDQKSFSHPIHFSRFEEEIIDKETEKLLEMGELEKVSYEENQVLFPIFSRPKKDGEYHMILNLKDVNEYIEYHHFRWIHLKLR